MAAIYLATNIKRKMGYAFGAMVAARFTEVLAVSVVAMAAITEGHGIADRQLDDYHSLHNTCGRMLKDICDTRRCWGDSGERRLMTVLNLRSAQ